MREFVFTIEYPAGADRLMDVFIEHPELHASAISISVSTTGMWRVDRVRGSAEALEAFTDAYTDPIYCNECGGDDSACTSAWTVEVLSASTEALTVYSHLDRLPQYCHSIPHLAILEFGDGLVFDAHRRQGIYEWRILMPEARPVGPLFDRLSDGMDDEVQIALRQLTDPDRWGDRITTIADLPFEQREAIETAVAAGYYSTPRSTDLEALATRLAIPKSTLRYRLRRAEAWIIESVVADWSLNEGEPDTTVSSDDMDPHP